MGRTKAAAEAKTGWAEAVRLARLAGLDTTEVARLQAEGSSKALTQADVTDAPQEWSRVGVGTYADSSPGQVTDVTVLSSNSVRLQLMRQLSAAAGHPIDLSTEIDTADPAFLTARWDAFKNSPPPNGTTALLGGKIKSPSIMEAVREACGKDKPRIAVILTSKEGDAAARKAYYKDEFDKDGKKTDDSIEHWFQGAGFEPVPINVTLDNPLDAYDTGLVEIVDGCDAAYMCGGSQPHSIACQAQPDGQDTPLTAALRRLQARGVLSGSSAGGHIQGALQYQSGDVYVCMKENRVELMSVSHDLVVWDQESKENKEDVSKSEKDAFEKFSVLVSSYTKDKDLTLEDIKKLAAPIAAIDKPRERALQTAQLQKAISESKDLSSPQKRGAIRTLNEQLGEPDIGSVQAGMGCLGSYGVLTCTHHDRRHRLGRLLVALKEIDRMRGLAPTDGANRARGLAVDENTGLIVKNGIGRVVGEGGVFFVDATNARFGDGPHFSVVGLRLTYLTEGDEIDLKTGRVKSCKPKSKGGGESFESTDLMSKYQVTKMLEALARSDEKQMVGHTEETDPQFHFVLTKDEKTDCFDNGDHVTVNGALLDVTYDT